ncbi:hypothetical protein GWO43_16255, partial [candidate division KSB1 bacterium]|nr:hypothetical protein [candidate division KSB1 bacterium]NIR68686.1 hypothetical protein [candidate division KSB1 bacterium]NIS25503.1 hypothetical protein [candidate division KSB1 bacterium]NIT72396.1 hypothetical protein [candidate division KSB1 bacterium]NIU26180.1 hypothetical protein [candidate division KSB1 bacterium]
QSQLKREVGYWVSARAREDGYLAVYREGVQLLKRATAASGAAATFPQLSLPDRDKILRSLVPFGTSSAEWGQIQHPLDLARSFFQRDRLRFRKFVVEDLLKGIYSSAVGWRLVKYDTWPGVPATDYDYTRPPAAIDAN